MPEVNMTAEQIIGASEGLHFGDDVVIYRSDGHEEHWFVMRELESGLLYLHRDMEWHEYDPPQKDAEHFDSLQEAYWHYDLWVTQEAYGLHREAVRGEVEG